MTNSDKIELLFNELGNFIEGSDYDGNLEYAYRNGYKLHACSLFMSTGAVSNSIYDLIEGITINRTLELKEINDMIENSYSYECKDCNHIGMYEENEGDIIECMNCLNVNSHLMK